MIPILFPATATVFTTNGIGRLSDAISCKVTEERNGSYELAMTYPVTGELFSKLQLENIIVAKPNYKSSRQPFRIYNIESNIKNTCTINARHISYDTSYMIVRPFSAVGISETLRILNIKKDEDENKVLLGDCPFTITTDIEASTAQTLNNVYDQRIHQSLRSCLGGTEGSILDRYSGPGTGEYEWDNYTIYFWKNRGADHGYKCRYGKNIVSLDRELDSSSFITGVLGVWKGVGDPETGEEEYVYGVINEADKAAQYPIKKSIVVDFSQDFENKPTAIDLNMAAKTYANNACQIKDSVELDFYDQDNQAVSLCDIISVQYLKLGVDIKVKIVKTVWNVLLDRYETITVGNPRSTLAKTIGDGMYKGASAVKELAQVPTLAKQ